MKSGKREILKRGFKASAERIATDYRKELGLEETAPLCAFKLSDYLDIRILTPSDLPLSQIDLDNILGTETYNSGWSALTMNVASGKRIIIHNDIHSPARQQSNIMHELAHVICNHQQPQPFNDKSLPLSMRNYDEGQELEANTLGSILLLPRSALIWALKRKMSNAVIAQYFAVSEEMVNYRIKMTGVARQLQYLK